MRETAQIIIQSNDIQRISSKYSIYQILLDTQRQKGINQLACGHKKCIIFRNQLEVILLLKKLELPLTYEKVSFWLLGFLIL